jgi:Xaa-Pro aminopeptidase
VVVVPVAAPPGAETTLYGFETLTLAPIDRALVEPALLTAAECAWLDAYHARVRDVIASKVDRGTAAWLDAATRPLAGS